MARRFALLFPVCSLVELFCSYGVAATQLQPPSSLNNPSLHSFHTPSLSARLLRGFSVCPLLALLDYDDQNHHNGNTHTHSLSLTHTYSIGSRMRDAAWCLLLCNRRRL
uniref:Putative secreted protein n=1 Tax=Anopheles triannulatus TaxID=58253 RepID=A0A2M4B1N6_9DIPT